MRRTLSLISCAILLAACGGDPRTGGETHWLDDVNTSQDASVQDSASSNDTSSSSDTSTSDTSTSADTVNVEDSIGEDAAQDAGEGSHAIEASDQVLTRLDAVTIAEITTEADAPLLVIFEGETLENPVVSVALDEPSYADRVVELGRDATDGERFTAALFADAGERGVYEPTQDTLLADADGPAQASFTVTYPGSSLSVPDQQLTHTTAVSVEGAALAGRGWLVVHPDTGEDSPDASVVLGAWPIAGVFEGSELAFDAPLEDGAVYFAMLHVESGDDPETYDGAEDLPATVDSAPIISRFVPMIPEGTPDATLNVNLDASGWLLTIEPAGLAAAHLDDPSAASPTLTLLSGWRYALENRSLGEHPFELVDDTGAALLSEAGAGSLDSDVDVNWSGGQFTAAASMSTLTTYRCADHTDEAGAAALAE